MARYLGSVCRHCRREGTKLFLKGQRCMGDKCAIEKRNYPPGQHGQKRSKVTEFGLQLREKQKVRRIYSIFERQFRNYFLKADKMQGVTGENLLSLLERRLDNVVYRGGFATSRSQARQLVRQNHFAVNGRKVNIPSFLVAAGDVVEVRPKSKEKELIKSALERVEQRGIPPWLELDREKMKAAVKGLPVREDVTTPIQEQLVVELYSK
ncbi:MAG: 30S ribosomal protein S4 [Candidatus Tectomicrobia bacterium]|uniref:Small ribosomal subunit protein uS4 n=1 Tax=Tectimicrobiota bacterium TaxID=2528274 RepID=A0A932GMJ3_UNCTE|nr:30S ribosomal protein S4 [Candidatus Tectomicrobia bacterium]